MSNHLKNQSSPYLLQHMENPVDWYPWCEEVFERAKNENRPVFLSIGYSTCHWCHVMAHESFEDKETADILNRYFISVKVDREERPDIDSVYMAVCQALTGSGGWPMSIFMTAEQKPFFAGTYFPPESRYGMMGFRDILLSIADNWKNGRARLLESAEDILAHISAVEYRSYQDIDAELPKRGARLLLQNSDKRYGGFGDAPKFPVPHNLIFLTLYSHINNEKTIFSQVELTLKRMREGGIFDQIGYGFSRYSTDRYFLVPHFEKMLYDNGLLIIAYAAAYKASDNPEFLHTAEQTAEYVFREMRGRSGEFYSAQDADSEGEEGRFYVFDYQEVTEVLGEEKGRQFCAHFGITPQGNFEGKNIPNLLSGNKADDDFDRERRLLYEYRRSRAKLQLDDKILTSWNSLMICAMTALYRVTGKRCYLSAAEDASKYIENNLLDGNTLYVSCRGQKRSVKGFLDEYAYYAAALLCLYGVDSRPEYLNRAREVCREAARQFGDKNGGCFLWGKQNDTLITRPMETCDNAMPCGNSMMAWCLVRLSQLTEDEDDIRAAEKQLAFMSEKTKRYPAGAGMFLSALLFYLNPPQKITVVLSKEDSAEKILPRLPLYADIKILEQQGEDYKLCNGKTTFYVCRDHTCLPPTNELK